MNKYNIKAMVSPLYSDKPDYESDWAAIEATNPMEAAATAQFMAGGEFRIYDIKCQIVDAALVEDKT